MEDDSEEKKAAKAKDLEERSHADSRSAVLTLTLLPLFHLTLHIRVAREMEEQKKRLRETDPQESLKVGLQTLANKSQKISAGVAAALAVLSASDSDSD